jgi:hypothetical protein
MVAELKSWTWKAWSGYPAAVVFATLYPTIFVLSQNWYALHPTQTAWLILVSIVAGLAIYAVAELALKASDWIAVRWRGEPLPGQVRPIVFGLLCTAILYALLSRTLKFVFVERYLLVPFYIALAGILIFAFSRGAQRHVSAFLALLAAIAGVSWAASAMDSSQSWIEKVRQDFESAQFKHKPNVYLFIYDAYSNEDAYRKVFDFDNTEHYANLRQRQFKVLHTFSNYRSTLQTAISVFLGKHHYYSTETGLSDTQKGRPLLAGVVHNPVLSTFKSNGYRLQYIHGLDYFVNEQGILDYMFPEKPITSSLRVFGLPLLKMRRDITVAAQKEALYARIHPPASRDGAPWFTFAHVNLPSHSPSAADWRTLGGFPARFREKTKLANAHMLETIDRIRAADPGAVIIIFGDHGGHRYNRLASGPDPATAFASAGVTPEIVALDESGIMIAFGSAGLCDAYVYEGMTPVNMFRSLFACLSDDKALLDDRAPDVTLYRNAQQQLFLMAKDGKALPTWEPFEPPLFLQ